VQFYLCRIVRFLNYGVVATRRINAKTKKNQANRMELRKKRVLSIEFEKIRSGNSILQILIKIDETLFDDYVSI